MYCTVLTASRSRGIGEGLTYEAGDIAVQPGSFLSVPLRKQTVEGIVLEVMEQRTRQEFELKKVQGLLSEEPFLTPAQLQTIRWMSEHYYCSLRQAMAAFLPSPPWKSLLPREVVGYTLTKPNTEVRGKKQQQVMNTLQGRDWVEEKELRDTTGASLSTLRSLTERGILRLEVHSDAPAFTMYNLLSAIPTLTPLQQQAYESIRVAAQPSLLFGITGSGKTEIYARLIADMALAGKQSILLVPEILLTEHIIQRFESLMDRDNIAMIHSRLTPTQRRDAWRRIYSGQAALVIGSRSALFSPCRSLGLVIIDEEHEWTYKNEQAPRYHARDTAEVLCRFSGAKLILGSATPSLESWAKAKSGQYQLVRLPERYRSLPLPNVRIIDLAPLKLGKMYPFSTPLLDAIDQRIRRGEQSVLFLNRRGMATALLCLQCRRSILSPATQLPFTVHHTYDGRPYLLDHFSGMREDIPATCPSCQSTELHPVGAGTQKLEDILDMRFPGARILRADGDTLRHPEQMRLLLERMRERQADILLGTQAVVKGLDLPGVTLAAVLIADIGLSLPHFRAGERVLQLLTQLTGRSGRAAPGEVIIQTFRPTSPEVLSAAHHQTESYLESELKLRIMLNYPPVVEMIRFILSTPDAAAKARQLQSKVQILSDQQHLGISVIAAPTFFGGGKVWHVLLRGTKLRSLLPKLPLEDVTVDIDPVDCL